ncbi:hypothetical protein GOBAR_DD31427 [Gossypium barbadense]|nr:hypothetical protein GOBAR_DD31427 [Gossypium barbadense]
MENSSSSSELQKLIEAIKISEVVEGRRELIAKLVDLHLSEQSDVKSLGESLIGVKGCNIKGLSEMHYWATWEWQWSKRMNKGKAKDHSINNKNVVPKWKTIKEKYKDPTPTTGELV